MNEKWRNTILNLAQVNPDDHTWRQHATCRGMDVNLFMPERGEAHTLRAAQQTCQTCPVRWNCLLYGLDEPMGVWGGLAEKQRRQLRPHWDQHTGLTRRQRNAS